MSDPADPDLNALLREARLEEARTLLSARVRADATDARARADLAELLVILGDWDKADVHADLASTYDPRRGAAVALMRQLIRAAVWRDATFAERRPPDLVTEPDAAITAALGRLAGVEAADEAPELSGTIDGRAFAGIRDLDDRFAGVLEVLSGDGRYLWVPWSAVESLKPAVPRTLRDLVWRPAEIEVRNGPAGTVFLPTIYPGTTTPAECLGRETEWVEEAAGVVGRGQRCWLIGDDVVTLDGVTELTVAA